MTRMLPHTPTYNRITMACTRSTRPAVFDLRRVNSSCSVMPVVTPFRIDSSDCGTMTYRTVVLSSLEKYQANTDETLQEIREQRERRQSVMERFPYPVMLEVAYPEMDYANRWVWQNFGPRNGECYDVRAGSRHSDYPICDDPEPHEHNGTWCCHWIVKTDYDFGFCEWYFSRSDDRDRFLEFAPSINWGEKFSSSSEMPG